jgi:hypothetical protein
MNSIVAATIVRSLNFRLVLSVRRQASVVVNNPINKMAIRKHTLNESAFDSITEESAYWIGFFMADGCITTRLKKDGKPMPSYIRLDLAVQDVEHVEKFKAFLGSTHKITIGHNGKSAVLAISSLRLAKALEQFGITSRKTHSAKVIGLEQNRDFWRGLIDGDGHITIAHAGRNRAAKAMLKLCGSKAMLIQFRDFVQTHSPDCRMSIKEYRGIYHIAMCGKYARQTISVLYSGCSEALERKRQKAVEILNSFPAQDCYVSETDRQEWLTQSKAAQILSIARSGIHRHINVGRFKTKIILGQRYVSRKDVLNYVPYENGRGRGVKV